MPQHANAAPVAVRPIPTGKTPGGVSFINQQAIEANTPLYDTIFHDLAVALPQRLDFFRFPVGTIGSGFLAAKELSETNSLAAGQLGYPRALDIKQVIVSITAESTAGVADGVAWNAVSQDFIASLLEDSILTIAVDDIEWHRDHIIRMNGVGITGLPDVIAAAGTRYIESSPFVAGAPRLLRPIPVPSRRRLTVRMLTNTSAPLLNDIIAGLSIYIRVYLQGNMSRAIAQ